MPSPDMNPDVPGLIGHHPDRPEGLGMDDDGHLIRIDDFAYPGDPADKGSHSSRDFALELLKHRAALGVLDLITAGAPDIKRMGQRAVVLLYLLKGGEAKSQKDLAMMLGLTPARVSQLVKDLAESNGLNRAAIQPARPPRSPKNLT